MRMNQRTLSAAVFAVVLMLSVTACKKKVPALPPPPPQTRNRNHRRRPRQPPRRESTISRQNRAPFRRGQSATLTLVRRQCDGYFHRQRHRRGSGQRHAPGVPDQYHHLHADRQLRRRQRHALGDGRSDGAAASASASAAAPKVSGSEEFTGILPRRRRTPISTTIRATSATTRAQALTHDADLLKRIFAADPGFTVVMEGHCDERGSAEYNLGLGDRRATAAKDFLVQLGVPADKIRTISYGKDRPVCTDATEACYQRNRRAHLAPAQ